jgi:hypothetical protein
MSWIKKFESVDNMSQQQIKNYYNDILDADTHFELFENFMLQISDNTDLDVSVDSFLNQIYFKSKSSLYDNSIFYDNTKHSAKYHNNMFNRFKSSLNDITILNLKIMSNWADSNIVDVMKSVKEIGKVSNNIRKIGYKFIIEVDIPIIDSIMIIDDDSFLEKIKDVYNEIIDSTIDDDLSDVQILIRFEMIKYYDVNEFTKEIDYNEVPKKVIDDFNTFIKKYSDKVSIDMKKDLVDILKRLN